MKVHLVIALGPVELVVQAEAQHGCTTRINSFHWLFFTSPSFFLHDFSKLSLTHSRSFCLQQPPPVFGPWLMFHPHHCCTSVEAEGPVSSYYDSGKENKVSLSWQRPVRACRHLSPAQSWSWENRYAGRRRRRAERGEKKFLEMV